MTSPAPAIVVFDGDCGLCNGFVAWLVRRDRHRRFLLAGSAGDVGRAALCAGGLDVEVADSTLVLLTERGARVRSAAVTEVAARLPWPWRVGAGIRIVPRPLRDRVYDAIAARRPRRPAEDPACGTPPPALVREWRARLATEADVRRLAGIAALDEH